MHPQTYAVATFENEDDAKETGYPVKLDKPTFYSVSNHEQKTEASGDGVESEEEAVEVSCCETRHYEETPSGMRFAIIRVGYPPLTNDVWVAIYESQALIGDMALMTIHEAKQLAAKNHRCHV